MVEKLENIIDLCLWKRLSLDKDNTTFQDVKEGHELYGCIECSGEPRSCPNYKSYNKLMSKYGAR